MTPTKLLYLEDFISLIGPAKVVEVGRDNDRDVIILDQTLFYPQGGGQPYDTGIMTSGAAKFLVEEVRFVDGIVRHIGRFESGKFSLDETVTCTIDAARRLLNSRLHSAGHVVDMAVHALKLPWIPGKGYHFPNSPYVEYEASLEDVDREVLRTQIEDKCNNLVKEACPTKILFIEKERMHESRKPTRVVLFGDFGVPCGGTHVNNLSEIGAIVVRKIKREGKNVQVRYDVRPLP